MFEKKDQSDAALKKELDGLPPTLVLALCYRDAPEGVRSFIDMQAAAVLGIELPKLHAVVSDGPLVDREDVPTLTQAYRDAMDSESCPPLTATIKSAGAAIAEQIDKATRRVLLDEKDCNRLEYLNLIGLHARIVSALDQLSITDEQRELMAKAKEEDDAANAD